MEHIGTVEASRRLEASPDRAALARAYNDVIEAILTSPLWAPERPGGLRIPWRAAREAMAHPDLRGAFASPGLYIFGSAAPSPVYLGMTSGWLKGRLMNRYVRQGVGVESQCQLAATYRCALVAHGLAGFPEEIRTRNGRDRNPVRLTGAVAFARHGIDGIWFALVPFADPKAVRPIEKKIISIAAEWNRDHGHPPLLNQMELKPYWPPA